MSGPVGLPAAGQKSTPVCVNCNYVYCHSELLVVREVYFQGKYSSTQNSEDALCAHT